MNVIVVEEVAGEYAALGTSLGEDGHATEIARMIPGREIELADAA